MKRSLAIIGLIVFTLVSCKLSQLTPFKGVIEYPEPELTIDNSYFTELGCFDSPDCLPDDLKTLDPPIGAIYEPSNLLGGLIPERPLALAYRVSFEREEEIPAVYLKPCMGRFYYSYLVNMDGEIRLIDSVQGMADLYAPIESENEALSYAMAVTGLNALYDLESQWTLKRYTKPLVESHSTYDGEKFIVHLFNTFLCGCGPHIASSMDVTVYPDGSFTLAEPVDAFSDPKYDGMCID